MQFKASVLLSILATMTLVGLATGDGMSATVIPTAALPATQPATTQPFQAVDLHNTVCPVSGEKVDDSKLVEVYDGKIYHLCCADCHNDFEKNPEKFAKAVSDDPAKYGVK
jgi:YHS domain-containing protein